jgi:hypothetical protein
MWLEAILSKEDVIAAITDLLPVTIDLDEEPGGGHHLELFEPRHVSLVDGEGLHMTCGARIGWPILGIHVPVTVESVTVMLRPSIPGPPGRDELVFNLEVEAIDFAWAPAVLDDRIAEKINHELAKKAAILSWQFGQTLGHVFKMPPFLHPLDAVALDVAWGKVRVTNEAVVIAVSFHTRVLRGDRESPPVRALEEKLSPARRTSTALRAPAPRMATMVAVAGGAVLTTLAMWAVVGSVARLWRYAARRA